jgi:GrpB-like predicted nucleotidyltransferase (UPF0157 family)
VTDGPDIDPYDVAEYDRRMQGAIGGPRRLTGRLEIQDYDPEWPNLYLQEEKCIRGALGDRVVLLAHAGSTSVPGLPAKPIIDLVLEVPDSADEPSYVSDLEHAGYTLRLREPEWFEHRLFERPGAAVHLHVFSAGSTETERMLLFRDWLRSDEADRDLYLRTKRELARHRWTYMQQYADAKSGVVREIMGRAVVWREGTRNRE